MLVLDVTKVGRLGDRVYDNITNLKASSIGHLWPFSAAVVIIYCHNSHDTLRSKRNPERSVLCGDMTAESSQPLFAPSLSLSQNSSIGLIICITVSAYTKQGTA